MSESTRPHHGESTGASPDGAPALDVLGGRYELGRVLGRGGMGVVRAATDLRLGRPVAVKLLHPDLAADPSARGRFEEEARAAARLVHPNVVAVFDTGEHDGTPFIVMESLPGRSLADEIVGGPLSPGRVGAVAGEVLDALGAAHRAGIIHRDIKPANVLLTDDGTAKVADFGIAKTAEGIDHTATGLIIGTPSYLAPERLAGRPATPRTDVYAAGATLYEALTGVKPTLARAPLGELRPDADPNLVDVVERAMAADPDERFATAEEMAQAFDEGRRAPATTPGVVFAPSRARRGRSRWALVAGSVAALLVVAVVLTDGEGGEVPAGAPTDQPEPDQPAPDQPAPELPAPLEERMRALEEAVRP